MPTRRLIPALLARDVGSYLDFLAAPATDRPSFPRTAAAAGGTSVVTDVGGGRRHGSSGRGAGSCRCRPTPSPRARSSPTWLAPHRSSPTGLVAGRNERRALWHRPVADLPGPGLARHHRDRRGVPDHGGGDAGGARRGARRRCRAATPSSGCRPAEGRFAEGVQVTGARTLTVREIIARHQAAAARQRRAIRQLISLGTHDADVRGARIPGADGDHARPRPSTPRPMPSTSSSATSASTASRSPGGGVPRLPIIEPERVASPPLAITLTDVYRYALDGTRASTAWRAMSWRSSRSTGSGALFAGRVWIAADSFAMVRVSAVQTGLRGPIVSSEQTDEFRPSTTAGWLLARSEVRQIYEGAGHRTPIHRVLAIDRQEMNPTGLRRAGGRRPTRRRKSCCGTRRRVPLSEARAGEAGRPGDRVAPPPVLTPPLQRDPHARARRDHRSQHQQAAAVCRSQLCRFQSVRHRHADQRLLRRHLRPARVLGAVARRQPLAARRPRVRHRVVVQRSRVRRSAASTTSGTSRSGPRMASVWVLRPLTSRVTVRAGYDLDYTHSPRSDSTAAVVRRAGVAGRARRCAWRSTGRARLDRLGLVGRRAARGLAAVGDVGDRPALVGVGEYDPGSATFSAYGVVAGAVDRDHAAAGRRGSRGRG